MTRSFSTAVLLGALVGFTSLCGTAFSQDTSNNQQRASSSSDQRGDSSTFEGQVTSSSRETLVVNNGAAALALAASALAAGREVVVSRGELIEIGDGFRLPDLLESTGARLREVGTTNRTHLADYRAAVGPDTGFVLKVHPSNFRVNGFTRTVGCAELCHALSENEIPLVVDIGSGLLQSDPMLPEEPDAASTLADGADLVTASGDKLLGGPQAGIVLGRADLIERLRRHPLARALRVDKLTLAALERAITGRRPVPGLIHHSDHGVQYASHRYVARLEAIGAQISMAAVGNVYENAMAESFFATLKREEVYLHDYRTFAEAEANLGRFLDDVYNHKRLHSSLGYRPPSEFEACWIDARENDGFLEGRAPLPLLVVR